MKLLVLGGTKFLGRAVVESALERGDEVTTFNRGLTDPELFPEVEKLRGDRDGDLSALDGREWDAVIEETVRDTLEWSRAGGRPGELASGIDMGRVGLAPERESELLEAWRTHA